MVRECSETVHMAALDGRSVVYIVKVDSTRAVRMVSAQGRRLSAHCAALGKMLLAQQSDEELEELYAGAEFDALTASSITSFAQLPRELAEVRATDRKSTWLNSS